jgi:2-polyprenyl-6-methoxyphenol hydroxylase-like FAD-dependent oxidoreductase
MKIAITGAGLAGLAAASFLRKQGHDVTVFERNPKIEGRGLGILVQPLGLSVLKQLGVLDEVIACGLKLDGIDIERLVNNKSSTISDVHYKDAAPDMFGVGIRRPKLFDILLDQAQKLGVTFVPGCDIQDAVLKGEQRQLVDSNGTDRGSFDLVVDGSGYRSPLRQKYATITHQSTYPDDAVCGTVEDDHTLPDGLKKETVYRYAGKNMFTIIPVGKDPKTGKDLISFFWAVRGKEYKPDNFDIAAWKKEVLSFMPQMKTYLDQITHQSQLVFAHYSDVALEPHHVDRLAFIGDSAHSTSPFLGQNASMGFVDALVLAKALQRSPDVKQALNTYSADRKDQVGFEQGYSRTMTNVFRSASLPVAFYRDHLMSKLLLLPGMKKIFTRMAARGEMPFKKSILHDKYGI